MRLLLDTGVLGQICHPRKHDLVRARFRRAVLVHDFVIPEIADYELRRELIRIGSRRSLARLDELGSLLSYAPVTTAIWRSASQLWAAQRSRGRPSADDARLDADVILAALAIAEPGTIVTTNLRHFAGLVPAIAWTDVPLE